ncbi:MAG: extracellular solute-binding protein [Treponema sp.]|nr:extracellular solute-binding protein [Treponema sp.]
MKRILRKFSAAILVSSLALFFSCERSADDGLVDIEIWYSPYSSSDAPLPDDWFGYKIIEDKLGIRLKTKPLPSKNSELNETILQAGKSNSLPDFFMCGRDSIVQLAKADKIARVDRMFEMMPRRTSMMYDEMSKKSGKIDGLTYGLCQIGAIDRNEGVLVRKDWLDKLGLAPPKTVDEYLTVLNAFTHSDPDGNGKGDTYGFGAFIETNNHENGLGRRFAPWFGAYGVAGTFNATRENAGINIHKPEYYDALSVIRKIVADKLIDPNWVAYKKDDFREAWKSGRFGMMREQNAALALESNYKPFDEQFPNGEWILIDPPVGPDGKSSVGCYTQSYRTFAVSKRASELGKMEHIAKLLEWMSTEGYNMIAYGLKDVNYSIDEDGKVSTKNLLDPNLAYTKKEVAPLLQLRNIVFYGSDAELIARYPTWYTKMGRQMSALTLLRAMQKKEWTPSVGVPGAPAELKKFLETSLVEFVTGKRNLTRDNWESWLVEFDKLGGAEWEKACMEQIEYENSYID